MESLRLGAKVRQLRKKEGLTQAQLAERLGISASYLNLIENDKRPLTAAMLLRLAELYELDLKGFHFEEGSKLQSDLIEAFADPIFAGHAVAPAELRAWVAAHPETARATLALYRGYRATRASLESMAETIAEPAGLGQGMDAMQLSSELVSDFIQRHSNFFAELEDGAAQTWADAHLEEEELFAGLARFLEKRHRVRVKVAQVGVMRGALRRYDAAKRELWLSEVLRRGSRNFQLAHQVALLHFPELLDRLCSEPQLDDGEARALARVSLANYFASAVLMPYGDFLKAAREMRYDLELLGHRFRTSFEQVCHRLTSLRKKGAEGVPFHMVRIDIAGNISKRFAASGIRFPRFSGLCPLWNVHAAFLSPGFIRTQISRLPDGAAIFSVSRTVQKHRGGYLSTNVLNAIGLGTDIESARELVYADGIDLSNQRAAVPVGFTCRSCEKLDCEARAFPPLKQSLRIDENVLGVSFYAPIRD